MKPDLDMPKQQVEIYQLRIWLKEISPMIWRRLFVRDDQTIADLHYCIQIIMAWTDTYLHQFVIQGKAYGIPHDGGISFSDNARKVYLRQFQFRLKERFTYEYNFSNGWEYEIRLERKLPIDPKKKYPICVGGNRAAPPEDCGGAWAFMELRDYYSSWRIEEKLIKLVKAHLSGKKDAADIEDDMQTLSYWFNQHRFNRRKVNKQLQEYFADENKCEKTMLW